MSVYLWKYKDYSCGYIRGKKPKESHYETEFSSNIFKKIIEFTGVTLVNKII